jgi:hypothetical protein
MSVFNVHGISGNKKNWVPLWLWRLMSNPLMFEVKPLFTNVEYNPSVAPPLPSCDCVACSPPSWKE